MVPPHFLVFPVELIERVLIASCPQDVASFSMTCSAAYHLVHRSTDQFLWRQLFLLHPFDDPRRSLAHDESKAPDSIDWKSELLRRMKARMIAFSQPPLIYEHKRALETFIAMVGEALPAKDSQESRTNEPSHNLLWLHDVLDKSRILDSTPLPNEARLYARLRSYLALTLDTGKDEKTQARLRKRRVKSRSYVYDLRKYNSETSWGPYMAHGRVNWVHVEHLMNVVLMNLGELPGTWAHTKPPLGLQATRPYSAPGIRSSVDWAGIEGTWRRYVCFMDYRDLFAFNYPPNEAHDPAVFEDPRFREATKLIEVKLRIVSRQAMRFHLPPSTDRLAGPDPRYPPLCFSGSAKGVQGNEAVIEGMVRMGVDGVARWQFVSVYDGYTQWSSDGIQVGNVGSAMGVVGVWTTALHDQGDPVGPFWLWKVEEDDPTHLMEYT
ncbi:hypothetical protein BDN72DRAFT_829885 [Pluteus cervinus]|uniref:Uncharacterized protein n=1 Tax=Pluteus cervinus TaxID=181527 RepID=A0ACD3BF43_9AGAR|nr:hypothetical protein BDN72DRAFT_829885 [Pluteus cervinus]